MKGKQMNPEHEKIAELKQKRQQMQEELDELEGNTAKGKLACVGVFLLVLAVTLGIFVGMIKTNVGGFAGNMLAPLISDVPVLRSILPKDMQEKSAAELAAEAQAAADVQAAAETQTAADTQAAADTQTAARAADASQTAGADAQITAMELAGAATGLTPAAANAPGTADQTSSAGNVPGTAGTSSSSAADTTASKVQDYVDAYSNMDPTAVAKILESMMPDDGELAAAIFKELPASQRSGILSSVSTDNAVWLTEQTSPIPKREKTAEELAAEQDAERAALQEQEKAAEDAALQAYVDTYSAMKPQDAAQIFDSIMPGQTDLVTEILQKLTVKQRADILSQMSVENAAMLTVRMQG